MLRINQERLLRNLDELAQIGRVPDDAGGGLDRRPFSVAERAARDYFRREAEAAGLTVHLDAAANLSARLNSADPTARTILTGSHLDTVPHGGPYDGALGVIAALEVLRTLREAKLTLDVHLEAIAFTDEEGRLGELTGSQMLTGASSREQAERFLANAARFPDDLAAMRARVPGGLTVASMLAAGRDMSEVAVFVEVHIEQGPRLEHAGVPIGVVDAIFGRRSYIVRFAGRSDHAGTTPMTLRADALVAAARFIAGAHDLCRAHFSDSVVTCGDATVEPGVYNVVPNAATVLLEFRAAHESTMTDLDEALHALMAETAAGPGLSVVAERTSIQPPCPMNEKVQATIRAAAAHLGHATLTFSSGALHDANSLAACVPTGMIFAPSLGGRSHCPDEETRPADLVAAADVLLHTVLALAGVQPD